MYKHIGTIVYCAFFVVIVVWMFVRHATHEDEMRELLGRGIDCLCEGNGASR